MLSFEDRTKAIKFKLNALTLLDILVSTKTEEFKPFPLDEELIQMTKAKIDTKIDQAKTLSEVQKILDNLARKKAIFFDFFSRSSGDNNCEMAEELFSYFKNKNDIIFGENTSLISTPPQLSVLVITKFNSSNWQKAKSAFNFEFINKIKETAKLALNFKVLEAINNKEFLAHIIEEDYVSGDNDNLETLESMSANNLTTIAANNDFTSLNPLGENLEFNEHI